VLATPDVPGLVGRQTELADIVGLLDEPDRSTSPRLAIISGAAGIGKTALAVHAAHRCAAMYPDGQFYLDLRGTGTTAVDPAQALLELLTALASRRPGAQQIDDRVRLYRSVLAECRVLLVLDNAADPAQVRPLLPPRSTSAAIITARTTLATIHGAPPLLAHPAQPRRVIQLIQNLVPDDRIAGRASGGGRGGDLCGIYRWPWAFAAAKLIARPHWSVGGFAGVWPASAPASMSWPSGTCRSGPASNSATRACRHGRG